MNQINFGIEKVKNEENLKDIVWIMFMDQMTIKLLRSIFIIGLQDMRSYWKLFYKPNGEANNKSILNLFFKTLKNNHFVNLTYHLIYKFKKTQIIYYNFIYQEFVEINLLHRKSMNMMLIQQFSKINLISQTSY